MRITNKVMQNNVLSNINKNKMMQDSLNTQLSTGKKIQKPSEDPVVAIRALRLRTDLSQIQQFYKKNIPDAQSWLQLTETAIKTTVSVVKSMITECERGASDSLETSDREKIIDSLRALRDEAYKTGDADYAGRYIFTGYRTDTSLTFAKPMEKEYQITEAFEFKDLDEMTAVNTANLYDITEANYNGVNLVEQNIDTSTYYRFRLAYDGLDKMVPKQDLDGNALTAAITVRAKEGETPTAYTYQPVLVNDAETAYKNAANNQTACYLVPSTGELVMGKEVYNKFNQEGVSYNITYNKSNWAATDLRPEHYFYCESHNDQDLNVKYNPTYLTGNASPDQKIEYQVGFDQHVQVNTYACDVYKHDISRDVDEIIDLAANVSKVEEMVKRLETMQQDPAKNQDKIELQMAAAKKAQTYMNDQLQKRFSKYITNSQGYLNDIDEALTIVGNRSKRVSLAENRLSDQETSFMTLQSNNEDADATEVAVKLSSAEVSYEAALMATGKMIQNTLLNYL
ncbi:MAG: flagellar hook-associated protein FlgL [Lachnospiraceae bacterium]|nr:flagellar hook-associated protein FlgL [Lachnospiraceae bacterium]